MNEFIRFSSEEMLFGKKRLLESQLNTLSLLKSFKEYKLLRKEELALKITLKNQIDSTLESINLLEKLLPKIETFETPQTAEQHIKKQFTIEEELEDIKRKLSSLR